jgi:ATP-dependent DNA ligase
MLWRTPPKRSRRSPPAGFILPCQPLLVDRPPAGSGWLHEVKHDGYRIIARKERSRVTLWSRYGTNFTDRLPKVAEAICSLAAESALIDGEAAILQMADQRHMHRSIAIITCPILRLLLRFEAPVLPATRDDDEVRR